MSTPTDPIALFGQLSGAEEWAKDKPKQRNSSDARGVLLYFPRTELVMVPIGLRQDGWHCVVVVGDETYPRGGYDVFVHDYEIECADEVRIDVADLL